MDFEEMSHVAKTHAIADQPQNVTLTLQVVSADNQFMVFSLKLLFQQLKLSVHTPYIAQTQLQRLLLTPRSSQRLANIFNM